MQPIHELLARIRHDKEFGKGQIEIGYFDRREGKVQRVALREVRFPEGGRRVFASGGRVRAEAADSVP